ARGRARASRERVGSKARADGARLVVDKTPWGVAFEFLGRAAVVLDDALEVPARHCGSVLLDVEARAGHELLADRAELSGKRHDQPNLDAVLRHRAIPGKSAEDQQAKRCVDPSHHRFLSSCVGPPTRAPPFRYRSYAEWMRGPLGGGHTIAPGFARCAGQL